MDQNQKKKVVQMKLTVSRAQKIVRDLAVDSANVILGDHAKLRMMEREITNTDVLRALRTGFVEQGPTMLGNGEWQVKFVMKIRGAREVGVVTIVLHDNRLFVKTVEWEDLS